MDRKWWTLVAVAAGIFMLLLDVTIVNVALPDIQQAFDASLSDLQWVIDAYALTLAALQLTAGSLADRFGRRLLFAIGIVVFTLGSLLCGLASGSTFLSLAAAFQGIGGAIMFATGLAIIASAFHGRDRGVAFGVFGAVTGVAVAVGPVIGGALTSGLSWRWIFLVNIPVGIVALFVTLRAVEESRDPNPRPVDCARPRHVQPRPRRARLRADPLQRGRLELEDRRRLADRRGGPAGRLRGRRGAAERADVRPLAVPQADVRRRADRGVRDLRLAVLGRSRTWCSTCRPGSACRRSRSACASSCCRGRSSSRRRSPGG